MSIKKLYFGMGHAKLAATASHSKKLRVGAAAFRDGRCVCEGYNGTPPGTDNTCEDMIDGKLVTRPEVEHAERNLIYFAAREGISLKGCTLYITHAPCMECARAILSAGFTKVFYREQYKTAAGVAFLKRHGVPCSLLEDL